MARPCEDLAHTSHCAERRGGRQWPRSTDAALTTERRASASTPRPIRTDGIPHRSPSRMGALVAHALGGMRPIAGSKSNSRSAQTRRRPRDPHARLIRFWTRARAVGTTVVGNGIRRSPTRSCIFHTCWAPAVGSGSDESVGRSLVNPGTASSIMRLSKVNLH